MAGGVIASLLMWGLLTIITIVKTATALPSSEESADVFQGGILKGESTSLWPIGSHGDPVVLYRIIDDNVNKTLVKAAISQWQENTCIRFEIASAGETNPHLQFTHKNSCHYSIGMISSDGQDISVGACQNLRFLTQFIGNAIGLRPVEKRDDRVSFIRINKDNVSPLRVKNFNNKNNNNPSTHSEPYDYSSIMHGHSKIWSVDGSITIASNYPRLQELIGKEDSLSHYDKLQANTLYPCIANWMTSCSLQSNPCQNDGYVGSDCVCVCRSGTSGPNCEIQQGNYYESLLSECTDEITLEGTITSPNYPNNYPAGLHCVKVIEAPECHTIELKFTSFQLNKRTAQCNGTACCATDALEIRTVDYDDQAFESTVYCNDDLQPGKAPGSTTITGRKQIILYFDTNTASHSGWSAQVTFSPMPQDTCRFHSSSSTRVTNWKPNCPVQYNGDTTFTWTSQNFGLGKVYPDNSSCQIDVLASVPTWSRLTLNGFNIPCDVYVWLEQPVLMSQFSKFLCSNLPDGEEYLLPMTSTKGFFQGGQEGAPGFKLTFTQETSSCHQLINAGDRGSTGVIVTPVGSNNDFVGKLCEWWIKAPAGRRIKLEFLTLDLEVTPECEGGSVIVDKRGGRYPFDNSYNSEFCGTRLPEDIVSSRNNLNLLFFSVKPTGSFEAKWTVV